MSAVRGRVGCVEADVLVELERGPPGRFQGVVSRRIPLKEFLLLAGRFEAPLSILEPIAGGGVANVDAGGAAADVPAKATQKNEAR